MTDMEMIKLCGEAMGIRLQLIAPETGFPSGNYYCIPTLSEAPNPTYDPLRDDGQALDLIKKFRLAVVNNDTRGNGFTGWTIYRDFQIVMFRDGKWTDDPCRSHSEDLNRAIVEYVANMQAMRE